MLLSERIITGREGPRPRSSSAWPMARTVGQRRAISDAAPAAAAVALGEEDPVRRACRPGFEPDADRPRIVAERLRRAQDHRAVGPLLDRDGGLGEARLAPPAPGLGQTILPVATFPPPL